MDLKNIPFPTVIDTSTGDIIKELFCPALRASSRYDRGVGYFSASWLRIAAEGMAVFASQGGRARWVTSPILSEPDWRALLEGEEARHDEIMHRALAVNILDLAKNLSQETLSALAWLVADNVLDFKLALPRNKLEQGEFHDKFGIFTDREGNQLSFNGSYNDSIQGTRNYESVKVFCSWHPAFEGLVRHDANRFERLWNNEDPNVSVYSLPEAARKQIVKLRGFERPYNLPADFNQSSKRRDTLDGPKLPESFSLRDYQQEAIKSWFENDCRGLFEMATGTGKTKTAVAAALQLYKRENRLLIIVACPETHLTAQWEEDITAFGFNSIFAFGSAGPWKEGLAQKMHGLRSGYIDNLVVLTTHATFHAPDFMDLVTTNAAPGLLIVDEVHEAGAPKRQLGLSDAYAYRLGLSATPYRWFDDEGTQTLFDYFGGSAPVFKFGLDQAIPDYLTPYEYHPHFVELTAEELEKYQEETRRLARRGFASKDVSEDKILDLLMILRQRIVVNAKNKYACLESLINDLPNVGHTLVYVSPQQIDNVQMILNRQGIIQSRFTGEESLSKRQSLLEAFASREYEMLVAMKCLDQGVDVPSTRTAILVANSGNPKQFIQRRGRVLRKFPDKQKAVIHDIIVVPTLDGKLNDETVDLERKILERELGRYDEFASLALNKISALNKIGPIKRKYLIT